MSARSFLRGLRSKSSRCTSCGSDATYPFPGRLRVLARIAGLERYSCRTCRGRFWLPLGAAGHHAHLASVTTAPVITRPPVKASDLVAIDAAVALPKPGSATAYSATARGGKRRRRRRR